MKIFNKISATFIFIILIFALLSFGNASDNMPTIFQKSFNVGADLVRLKITKIPYNPPQDQPNLIRPMMVNGQKALAGLPHDPKSKIGN